MKLSREKKLTPLLKPCFCATSSSSCHFEVAFQPLSRIPCWDMASATRNKPLQVYMRLSLYSILYWNANSNRVHQKHHVFCSHTSGSRFQFKVRLYQHKHEWWVAHVPSSFSFSFQPLPAVCCQSRPDWHWALPTVRSESVRRASVRPQFELILWRWN